jgi:hypothetical protein
MPIAKRPWNGPGDVPYYVIKSLPKTADGSAVVDPVIHRIRPTGYPTKEEALDRAFKIIDQGRIVAEIKGLDINLSMAEVKNAYAQRPKP